MKKQQILQREKEYDDMLARNLREFDEREKQKQQAFLEKKQQFQKMIKEQHDTMKDQYIKRYNEEIVEG